MSYLSELDEEEIRLLRYVANSAGFEKRMLSALGRLNGKRRDILTIRNVTLNFEKA